jgi:stage II sporulation protein D
MFYFPRLIPKILILSLIAPITIGGVAFAQEVRERRVQTEQQATTGPEWPSQQSSVTQQAAGSPVLAKLSSEPVMRIALATETHSVTISTTSHLLNASEVAAVPLETARVRIESRALSPQSQVDEAKHELELARGLSREDAERLSALVRERIGKDARLLGDSSANKWRVVIQEPSREAADATSAKLEDAGFEVLNPANGPAPPAAANGSVRPVESARTSSPDTRSIRLTARTGEPTREVVAFTRGAAPFLHSSAPVVFASDDAANAPVRFNETPYRGRIEVFANPHGSLTVVNVIAMEDYVRGVVPNELSPGSFPAVEALKAQAIAARTYALKNRGQFASEGFDLLPTTRSQVYRGLSSEQPLSSLAVDETRGIIATYHGEPINAMYTSTCGGRTEDSENIFNTASPYLRGRECAAEGKAALTPFVIKTARELFEIKEERDLAFARDAALLSVNGFSLPVDRVSDSWLSGHVSESEVRDWLTVTARFSRHPAFAAPNDATRAPAFSSALIAAVYGDKRADTLLNNADVDYLLGFRDADEVPAANRADVAMLLRDGCLSLFADATLRPRDTMSRAGVLHAIARILETRGLLALQKGTTRPANAGILMLRSSKGKEQPIVVGHEAFLFREFGDSLYQMRSVTLVGGEPVTFHVGAQGMLDYLEVKPAPNGAAAERFSQFTNWTSEMSVGQVEGRMGRSIPAVGSITDLRVLALGSSRRVIDLEVVGTRGVAHIRGGRIRSALGLREQLFVIDRVYDGNGRVTEFIFTGRGFGHGVGMCQVGAYGLARQGFTSEQILKAYYTGIELTKFY